MSELWPEGISDGLTLPCGVCGIIPDLDYNVIEEFWREVVPDNLRLGVICLKCLDVLSKGGVSIPGRLIRVQWIGSGYTIVLVPSRIVRHPKNPIKLKKENQDESTTDHV